MQKDSGDILRFLYFRLCGNYKGVLMNILENERIDYVNDKLSLIQKTDGLTFGTDALLLAGYIKGKFGCGIELGGGSGIISMLLLTRGKVGRISAIEIQEDYARLIERNAELNGLADNLFAVHSDIRDYRCTEECDIVFSNPPYMRADAGLLNTTDAKTIARHEIYGDIYELIYSATKCLKYGGAFYLVYRPDRLCDLICAMRECRVEPKRITFVHARVDSEPSMVLIEGKKGAKPSINVTRPLIIYENGSENQYTEDMNYIMENGSFPKDFSR